MQSKIERLVISLGLVLLASTAVPASAYWPLGASYPISLGLGDAYDPPRSLQDGAGGMIAVWEDNYGILRGQRLNADGVQLWSSGGVKSTQLVGASFGPSVSADGFGGLLVAWFYNGPPTPGVFVQRISAEGIPLWGANALSPAPNPYDQRWPSIVGTGDGGAIVVWTEHPLAFGQHIKAQRISPSGALLWGASGMFLSGGSGEHAMPVAIADSTGGAHVAWMTYINYDVSGIDLLIQHVTGGGVLQSPAGTSLCSQVGDQDQLVGASTPQGGAAFGWRDQRQAGYSGQDIWVQQISQAGARQWQSDGLPACNHTHDQIFPSLAVSADGVTWIAWQDDRFGAGVYNVPAIFVQGLAADGTRKCGEFGRQVSSAPSEYPTVGTRADGAALVGWMPQAGGIRYQCVRTDGSSAWGDTGVAVAVDRIIQHTGSVRLANSRDGLLWTGTNAAGVVYARVQSIGQGGDVGVQPVAGVVPRPRELPRITAGMSPTRTPVSILASVQNVLVSDLSGRRVAQVKLEGHGQQWSGAWDLRNQAGEHVAPGLYFLSSTGSNLSAATRVVVLR